MQRKNIKNDVIFSAFTFELTKYLVFCIQTRQIAYLPKMMYN